MILHLLQLGSHQCWLEYLWVPIINMHNRQTHINRFKILAISYIWHYRIFKVFPFSYEQAFCHILLCLIGFQCTQSTQRTQTFLL
ncbi:unnamed protein product [Sphagnum compactum]